MAFAEEQVAAWSALSGVVVSEWEGVEMALRDDVDGRAQFNDSAVPCLQLFALDLLAEGGVRKRIGTYQNDDTWGLGIDGVDAALGEFQGIFRKRPLHEVPVGHVAEVSVALAAATGDIGEVRLECAGRPIVLVAGELHEDSTGRLIYHRGDESVLLFLDVAAAQAAPWVGPTMPTRRRSTPRGDDIR